MSSYYSPFGNAPARLCQRCGRPLSPNEVYCGGCGHYNTPAQSNSIITQSSSGMSWGGATPPPTYNLNQNGGQPWGQSPIQPPQNNSFSNYPTSQQPFNMPGQPLNSNNSYGSSAQQSGVENFYASPSGQPSNPGNLYGVPASPQPYYPQPSPQPTTGGFQTGNPNGYQPAGFAQPYSQPVTGGFQPGIQNGYQSAGFAQPPGRKSGSRIVLIIGIIALLLVVTGGAIWGYLSFVKSPGTTTTQPTLSIVPTSVPKGTPLFSDPFTSNKNGWDTTGRSGQFSVKIGSGSLILEDDNNKLLWEVVPGGRTFKDFYLTTDAALSKGTQTNGYGIYIRGASNQNVDLATYYRFEFYGDGTFAIFKGTVDASGTTKSNLLVTYTASPAILKQGQVNHIAISAKGPTISLIVNGQTLKTINDNSYTTGSIALFVSNLQNTAPGAQATFSNFAIYPSQS